MDSKIKNLIIISMKNKLIITALLLFMSSQFIFKANSQTNKSIIGKPDITVKNGIMTPEALWSFGRIGEVAV